MRRTNLQSVAPAFLPNPRILSEPIPDGDAGITRTVGIMKGLTLGKYGAKNWMVRQAALEAVRGTERGMPEIDAVMQWVKDNIEFRGEYGETLQDPFNTLRWRAGDCDDQSMLTAAMLAALGYETRFRTISLADSPDDFSHVYAEVRDKQTGVWLPIDTTVRRSYTGWYPEQTVRSASYGTMSMGGGTSLLEGLAAVLGTLGALYFFG